jgi:hypothetical protein
VERVNGLNKAGVPGWWLVGRVLRRKRLSKLTLKIFDKTIWLWRVLDYVLPWPGLSMLVVARKPSAPGAGLDTLA